MNKNAPENFTEQRNSIQASRNCGKTILKNLQIRTVPNTVEIFPWIVTKPAFPAFCNSLEPTESNVPTTERKYFNSYPKR